MDGPGRGSAEVRAGARGLLAKTPAGPAAGPDEPAGGSSPTRSKSKQALARSDSQVKRLRAEKEAVPLFVSHFRCADLTVHVHEVQAARDVLLGLVAWLSLDRLLVQYWWAVKSASLMHTGAAHACVAAGLLALVLVLSPALKPLAWRLFKSGHRNPVFILLTCASFVLMTVLRWAAPGIGRGLLGYYIALLPVMFLLAETTRRIEGKGRGIHEFVQCGGCTCWGAPAVAPAVFAALSSILFKCNVFDLYPVLALLVGLLLALLVVLDVLNLLRGDDDADLDGFTLHHEARLAQLADGLLPQPTQPSLEDPQSPAASQGTRATEARFVATLDKKLELGVHDGTEDQGWIQWPPTSAGLGVSLGACGFLALWLFVSPAALCHFLGLGYFPVVLLLPLAGMLAAEAGAGPAACLYGCNALGLVGVVVSMLDVPPMAQNGLLAMAVCVGFAGLPVLLSLPRLAHWPVLCVSSGGLVFVLLFHAYLGCIFRTIPGFGVCFYGRQPLVFLLAMLLAFLPRYRDIRRELHGEHHRAAGSNKFWGLFAVVALAVLASNWCKPVDTSKGLLPRHFRVATFNMQQGFNIDGESNIQCIHDMLTAMEANVTAFQESDTLHMFTGNQDRLGHMLGAIRRAPAGSKGGVGVGIKSYGELLQTRQRTLASVGPHPIMARTVLGAEVATGAQASMRRKEKRSPVFMYTIDPEYQPGLGSVNADQIAEGVEWILNETEGKPTIIFGEFGVAPCGWNSGEKSVDAFKPLKDAGFASATPLNYEVQNGVCKGAHPTIFHGQHKGTQMDYIWYRGLRLRNYGVFGVCKSRDTKSEIKVEDEEVDGAALECKNQPGCDESCKDFDFTCSDHRPVYADFELLEDWNPAEAAGASPGEAAPGDAAPGDAAPASALEEGPEVNVRDVAQQAISRIRAASGSFADLNLQLPRAVAVAPGGHLERLSRSAEEAATALHAERQFRSQRRVALGALIEEE